MNCSIDPVESLLQSDNKTINQMAVLLDCYGFDLQERSPAEYIDYWLTSCSRYWIRLAIIEALYQGRYKAVSVDHILRLWKRRGHPTFHFPHEFERLICRNVFVNQENIDKIESQSSTTKFQETKKVDQPDKKDIQPQPLNNLNSLAMRRLTQFSQDIPLKSELSSPTINFNNGNLDNELPVDEFVSLNTKSKKVKSKRSIHQFIPHSDSSQLYIKLRAAVYQKLAQ
ncbi:hypothetical protein [cyanobacterium endosymbiont of Epithemia clementina EcSB]|uniref:hypothetical protein n=1 Tax=cyanobacterium endosymbiont of Epithemia clementina EcSB TaxID=3034674 RepID=UPI00247FAB24|nr:hypothetical protein [cyanobacterium endosymbiont of Epithemia clementina EcSB]WGT67343.1 hypothetical protein P3F56_09095 [cyanobacterium endosymbiont of Epithemia clementina EcSB]